MLLLPSNADVVKPPLVPLCNDVDIADGTWTDVTWWRLDEVVVPPPMPPPPFWCKIGICSELSKFKRNAVLFDDCVPVMTADCVVAEWTVDTVLGGFADIVIGSSADVDVDRFIDVAKLNCGLFNAMEDECNGFTFSYEEEKRFYNVMNVWSLNSLTFTAEWWCCDCDNWWLLWLPTLLLLLLILLLCKPGCGAGRLWWRAGAVGGISCACKNHGSPVVWFTVDGCEKPRWCPTTTDWWWCPVLTAWLFITSTDPVELRRRKSFLRYFR